MTPRSFTRACAAALVLVLPVAASTPPAAAEEPWGGDPSVTGTHVEVGSSECGAGWGGGAAGPTTFALWNNAPFSLEVYLQEPSSGRIYLDVEYLGVGATRSVTVTLAPGRYRFVCAATELDPVGGATVDVTGTYDGPTTPGVLPVTTDDLTVPILRYQRWVRSRLPALSRQVTRLATDLHHGRVGDAKRDWLTAHLTYETLGAAYDAFGDYDQEDAFGQIEGMLWHGRAARAIYPHAKQMIAGVARLRADFGTRLAMAPIDMGLRAHEILENALQFELTGTSDHGSHTELATIDANIDGTRKALAVLRGVLVPRDPDLPATNRWLDRLQRLVRSHHTKKGWTPLGRLSDAERQQLNATMSQTLEYLSEVAVITDPVRPMP